MGILFAVHVLVGNSENETAFKLESLVILLFLRSLDLLQVSSSSKISSLPVLMPSFICWLPSNSKDWLNVKYHENERTPVTLDGA